MKNVIFASMLLGLVLTSCRKDEGAQTAPMTVRMMDAPSPYAFEEVNVDIRGVEASISGTPGWITLQVNPGIYNLLEFSNGLDTVIAAQLVPEGMLSQVRLVLGENNSVRVNGQLYPLTVPSGSSSGLKLNVHQQIMAGHPFNLYLDFDAGHSIVQEGNGSYSLKPVIRSFMAEQTGIIRGNVMIASHGTAVIAAGASGEFATYAEAVSGGFMLRGLSAGTYTLKIYRPDSDIPVELPGIEVTAGAVTEVGGVGVQQ